MTVEIEAVVIGAGQAGLSSAFHLRRLGVPAVVLDAADGPGGAWRHRSPSLTMDKIHGIFDLPGVTWEESGLLEPGAADAVRQAGHGPLPREQARVVVPRYYGDYERRTGLEVLRPVTVSSVTRTGSGLLVSADAGQWAARAVVNATGTWSRPHWPYYPGLADFRGRQLHYAGYDGPDGFAGRRVAVVGGGASAMHVLSEVAGVAATVLWVTRRPPVWREEFGEQARREAVARVEARVRAGLPPTSVVGVTGLGSTVVVREALAKGALGRRPMFSRLLPYGVAWADGSVAEIDTIVWATGFRSALDHLAPLKLREPGGGIRVDGTAVAKEPRLQLVGYGPSASTVGANRAGRAAARRVRDLLRAEALPAA
ncbi:NAD(P)-binding domain-containing protein [Nonomuraea soli]